MSILYDLYTSPSTKEGEQNTPSYHARVVNRQTLDAETLINHLCERGGLNKGPIVALFEELGKEMERQLLAGNSVMLPNIGSFSLSLQSPSDANPKTTRAEHIHVKRIEFRAENRLRNDILKKATFERSAEKKHSSSMTNEEVNAAVRQYLEENSFMTRTMLENTCQLTKGTALNHIRRLVKEGVIVNTNTPRQPIYVLKKE